MPTVGKRRGGLLFCGLGLGLRLLTGQIMPSAYGAEYETCKFFSQLPDDCAGAELRKFDGLRDYRYEEIDLFAKDPLKGVLYVSTYNTTGQNAGEDTRELGAEGARAKRGPEAGRETISGAFGRDQSAPHLDAGLALGQGRRREEFRRNSTRRGWETAWRREPPPPTSPAQRPITPCWWRDRPSRASRKDRRSICSTTPRTGPGSWWPIPTRIVRA